HHPRGRPIAERRPWRRATAFARLVEVEGTESEGEGRSFLSPADDWTPALLREQTRRPKRKTRVKRPQRPGGHQLRDRPRFGFRPAFPSGAGQTAGRRPVEETTPRVPSWLFDLEPSGQVSHARAIGIADRDFHDNAVTTGFPIRVHGDPRTRRHG